MRLPGVKAGGRPDRLAQIEWAAALVAAGAALFSLVVVTSHAGALWRDEVNSVNTVSAPSLAEFVRLAEFDSFPLLWLLLLRGWVASGAGSTDFGLRIFGLLGGLALFLAIGFAALRLGRRPPLASIALLAVNPGIVRWGGSVRAWALGAALTIVALVLVREATAQPSRWRIALAALFAVLSVQCVYQNPVLLAAVVGGATAATAAQRRWKRAIVPMTIGAVAAVSLLPYVPLLLRVSEWRILVHTPLTLDVLAERAGAVFAESGTIVLVCWAAFFGIVLVSVGWRALVAKPDSESERRDVPILALVTIALSSVGLAIFLLQLGHPTEAWYYLGWIALIATCGEAAIAVSTQSRTVRLALAAMTVVILVAGLPSAWATLERQQTNIDAIALYLEEHEQDGDLIVLNPWYLGITFGRYYHGNAEVMTIPPLEDRSVHRYDLFKKAMLAIDPIGPLHARIRRALESGGRVWLVGGLWAPRGSTEPPRLRGPPLPGTGWNMAPYEDAWTLQTGALLKHHARTASSIELPRKFSFEYASLLSFKGWR